jgi:membrane protein DedA with SNARE-associated domain
VGIVIGLESLGIPLPGEIILVSAALLSSQHAGIDPVILGVCATVGAIVGDSIGYAIGRKGGRPMLAWLGKKFPRHFSEGHIATAERSFQKWGMWAVFFGRFVALLRIFAGPLAGVLRMPYWKFLIANVLGGILWAGGTTAVIYYVGIVAESWLKRFSWLGLVAAVLVGLTSMLVIKRKAKNAAGSNAAGSNATADNVTAQKQAAESEPEPVPAAD